MRNSVRRPGGNGGFNGQPFRGGGGRPGAQEFEFEGTGFSDFFEQIFGGARRGAGGRPGGSPFGEPSRDVEGDIMVTLQEAQSGSIRTVTVRHENHTDSQQVKIPAGITEGQKLRIAGRGQAGGDLYLRVRLAKHPDFEVDGHNLIHELELAPWEAALGAEISVPTLTGRVNIKIPAGTASGQKLRVRGRGLGPNGDLLITTKIVVPDKISDAQKKLWEQLASESKFNPRD
ncbi:MAG: DnaJ C-terminal domain-containing protein [Limisphaerales bacterium]